MFGDSMFSGSENSTHTQKLRLALRREETTDTSAQFAEHKRQLEKLMVRMATVERHQRIINPDAFDVLCRRVERLETRYLELLGALRAAGVLLAAPHLGRGDALGDVNTSSASSAHRIVSQGLSTYGLLLDSTPTEEGVTCSMRELALRCSVLLDAASERSEMAIAAAMEALRGAAVASATARRDDDDEDGDARHESNVSTSSSSDASPPRRLKRPALKPSLQGSRAAQGGTSLRGAKSVMFGSGVDDDYDDEVLLLNGDGPRGRHQKTAKMSSRRHDSSSSGSVGGGDLRTTPEGAESGRLTTPPPSMSLARAAEVLLDRHPVSSASAADGRSDFFVEDGSGAASQDGQQPTPTWMVSAAQDFLLGVTSSVGDAGQAFASSSKAPAGGSGGAAAQMVRHLTAQLGATNEAAVSQAWGRLCDWAMSENGHDIIRRLLRVAAAVLVPGSGVVDEGNHVAAVPDSNAACMTAVRVVASWAIPLTVAAAGHYRCQQHSGGGTSPPRAAQTTPSVFASSAPPFDAVPQQRQRSEERLIDPAALHAAWLGAGTRVDLGVSGRGQAPVTNVLSAASRVRAGSVQIVGAGTPVTAPSAGGAGSKTQRAAPNGSNDAIGADAASGRSATINVERDSHRRFGVVPRDGITPSAPVVEVVRQAAQGQRWGDSSAAGPPQQLVAQAVDASRGSRFDTSMGNNTTLMTVQQQQSQLQRSSFETVTPFYFGSLRPAAPDAAGGLASPARRPNTALVSSPAAHQERSRTAASSSHRSRSQPNAAAAASAGTPRRWM